MDVRFNPMLTSEQMFTVYSTLEKSGAYYRWMRYNEHLQTDEHSAQLLKKVLQVRRSNGDSLSRCGVDTQLDGGAV